MANSKTVLVEKALLDELLAIAKENNSAFSDLDDRIVETSNSLDDLKDTVNEMKNVMYDIANKLGV